MNAPKLTPDDLDECDLREMDALISAAAGGARVSLDETDVNELIDILMPLGATVPTMSESTPTRLLAVLWRRGVPPSSQRSRPGTCCTETKSCNDIVIPFRWRPFMYADESNKPGETGDRPAAIDGAGWEVIHRYTRAEALEDGTLVDVSETAREAGIKFPVAVTRAVWNKYVALTPAAKRAFNSERGRLWDVVSMLRFGIMTHRNESCFLYQLHVVTRSVRASLVTLKAQCDGGDDGEPVITVLLPDED
jgi:hypothetical protein